VAKDFWGSKGQNKPGCNTFGMPAVDKAWEELNHQVLSRVYVESLEEKDRYADATKRRKNALSVQLAERVNAALVLCEGRTACIAENLGVSRKTASNYAHWVKHHPIPQSDQSQQYA
jgi:hypothetical protein